MTKEAEQALVALEHCGVIRVRFDHPGYLELFDRGIATITPVDSDDDALDYRIAQ